MRSLWKISIVLSIAIASLPIALTAVDSPFGLGSFLIVPTIAVGIVFTVTTPASENRAWWFAFTVVGGLWLCLCPAIIGAIMSVAHYLQDINQRGTISLSQRVIEPSSLLLIVAIPFLSAVVTGGLAGRAMKRWVGESKTRGRWQISTRELLVGMAGVAILLGVVFSRVRTSRTEDKNNQTAYLFRFESSFTSGKVSLSGSPQIQGLQRTLIPESGFRTFLAPGVNEYRVIAPINKGGHECWGLWVYTCNGEHKDMIYQFGYAEAKQEHELPSMPFPMKAYVNATWTMVDGVPK